MNWYLYIVKCADGSLYTGITTDLNRRVKEHNTDTAKGAKSLRGKKPVVLVYSEMLADRSAASLREAAIKKLSRNEKLQLIKNIKSS